MRLLQLHDGGRLSLVEYIGKNIPPYAILSHTWGADHEEVNFKDLIDGVGQNKVGYAKIHYCGTQATKDGLQYFWVDTCCIDKSNNTELTEALNSMFRWYQESSKCYVYLSDVAGLPGDDNIPYFTSWEAAFRKSRWFTRGWTLQELIAPATVEFFSADWNPFGNKLTLQRQIHEITGIPIDALQCRNLSYFTVFERMSWASNRQTKREEDLAYSLMGIFNVYLSPIYGEGTEHALKRLQEEISRRSKGSLDQLPHVPQAVYNSYDNRGETTCLPDTRVQVLQEIRDWFQKEDGQSIFWLSGLAGMGKTTIARTVAQEADGKGSLGASFFFARRTGDLDNPRKFIPSIAVQYTRRIPALETPIRESLEKYPDLPQLRLQDQWRHLIHGPISRLPQGSYPPRLLLVIDALDECEGDSDVRELLRLLQEAKDIPTFHFRVLITSRPETPIRLGFRQMPLFLHRDLSLQSLSREIVDQDIRTYLIHEFTEIKQQFEIFTHEWPSEDNIDTLVQDSGGLFIYAATVCRFIRSNDQWGAEDLLKMILPVETTQKPSRRRRLPRRSPFSDLDTVYNQVLEHSLKQINGLEDYEEIAGEMGEIVSTIALVYEPLSVDALASLFDINQGTIYQRLKYLRSVLEVPDDRSASIRLLHPSFREFLFDPKRCTTPYFSTDRSILRKNILESCVYVLSDALQKDICGVQKPGTRVTDVSKAKLTEAIPAHIEYACIYWVQHLLDAQYEMNDHCQVFDFLKKHALHWLEVLSWLQKLSYGINVLRNLKSQLSSTNSSLLMEFMHDLERFALYSRQAIEQAPLQVYASALFFAPGGSVVRKQYQTDIPRWAHQLSWTEETWSLTLQTLEGHSGIVNEVAFSPDGSLMASASYDCSVRLWDGYSGRQLQTLVGHSDTVRAVRFSPDGDTICSSSDDHTIILWDSVSGDIKQTLGGHLSGARAVAYSPDGSVIASGGFDDTVRLWDAKTGVELHTLEGHVSGVFSVAFSRDGDMVASSSWDYTVKLWNVRSGRELHTLRGHTSGVRSVAISPTSSVLVTGSYDRTIRLWDLNTGICQRVLVGHSGGVRAITFSPNGRVLASSSYDNTVKLWDVQSGRNTQTLSGHLDYVNSVAFSPDGTTLASGSDDHNIKIWDSRPGLSRETLQGHLGSVDAVAISSNGALIASASDENVKLWDAYSGHETMTLTGHSAGIRAVVFSPDSAIIASASYDASVKLWDVHSGRVLYTLSDHLTTVNDIAFTPDGKFLASASSDCTVKLWDIPSGEEQYTLECYSGWVTAVCFSPDGATLATAAADKTILLLDVQSGLELRSLRGQSIVNLLYFSSDGSFLWTEQGFIRISTGEIYSALPSPSEDIQLQPEWIVRGDEKLLWLPPEYRARRVAVFKNKVVFGHASGQVSILEIL